MGSLFRGSPLRDGRSDRLQPGQIWTIKDSSMHVQILKVDQGPELGTMVHVAVLEGDRVRAGHLPFSEQAVLDSVLEQVGSREPAHDWRDGYALWKGEFLKKKAGVFTMPVAEAVEVMLRSLEQARGES